MACNTLSVDRELSSNTSKAIHVDGCVLRAELTGSEPRHLRSSLVRLHFACALFISASMTHCTVAFLLLFEAVKHTHTRTHTHMSTCTRAHESDCYLHDTDSRQRNTNIDHSLNTKWSLCVLVHDRRLSSICSFSRWKRSTNLRSSRHDVDVLPKHGTPKCQQAGHGRTLKYHLSTTRDRDLFKLTTRIWLLTQHGHKSMNDRYA